MIFPDGQEKELKYWNDILITTARWALPKLKVIGKLPLDRKAGRYLIHSSQMIRRFLDDNWWLETNFSARTCVRWACYILEQAGVNPEDVKVTF